MMKIILLRPNTPPIQNLLQPVRMMLMDRPHHFLRRNWGPISYLSVDGQKDTLVNLTECGISLQLD
jgi:hypothetical protein